MSSWFMACLLMPARSARAPGRTPSGPGNCSTAMCGKRSSSKPEAFSSLMIRRRMACAGTRRRAPMSEGGGGHDAVDIFSKDSLPSGLSKLHLLMTFADDVYLKELPMPAPTIDLSVNPADETISFGPLAVRFLLTGDNSTGSIAAFELMVRGGQRLPAPAHSHDHYEETIYGLAGVLTWTVSGRPIEVGPGQALCIPRGAIHRFDNLA